MRFAYAFENVAWQRIDDILKAIPNGDRVYRWDVMAAAADAVDGQCFRTYPVCPRCQHRFYYEGLHWVEPPDHDVDGEIAEATFEDFLSLSWAEQESLVRSVLDEKRTNCEHTA